jgi:hypothetical protein
VVLVEEAVDLAGDEAFEAASDLAVALALAASPLDVLLGFRIAARDCRTFR